MTSNPPHNEVVTPISAQETNEANTLLTSVSFNEIRTLAATTHSHQPPSQRASLPLSSQIPR